MSCRYLTAKLVTILNVQEFALTDDFECGLDKMLVSSLRSTM